MPKQKFPKSILRLKVKGPNIRPGRIPIPELLVICEQAQNAVNRQAEALRGRRSLRPGPTATVVKTECTLELFKIGRGSAAISFAGPEPMPSPALQGVLDLDIQQLGEAAVREVVKSLRGAKRKGRAEMDIGVRRSFEEMGQLLTNGVSSIEFIVPGQKGKKGQSRMTATFDQQVWEHIGERKDTATKDITLDGRLEMADFKLGDLKCIIHTSDNQRIICSFPTEIEDEVYKALRHVTRVSGTATINLKTSRPEQMVLQSLAVLDPYLGQADDFFSSRSIQQLTQLQRTDPKFDLRTLENGWPEDEDVDTFLAAIEVDRSA